MGALLESMLDDPVSRALAMAPVEDEEIGEENRAVARSKEWFRHHEGTPFENVVAEMGLSMEDIRNYKEPD